jgi:hypothetical protein
VFLRKRGAVVISEEVVVFRTLAQQSIDVHSDEGTATWSWQRLQALTGGVRCFSSTPTFNPLRLLRRHLPLRGRKGDHPSGGVGVVVLVVADVVS